MRCFSCRSEVVDAWVIRCERCGKVWVQGVGCCVPRRGWVGGADEWLRQVRLTHWRVCWGLPVMHREVMVLSSKAIRCAVRP